MEIFITVIFIVLAIYILFNSFKKSSKGGCKCTGCSDNCPANKNKCNTLKIDKNEK
ncbi:MAG: FeoB-associated Cys-rich membrane protein [Clostridium sp.]|nr:FeoB-associated Cys-rich membrane protein [Clostridium sp.]